MAGLGFQPDLALSLNQPCLLHTVGLDFQPDLALSLNHPDLVHLDGLGFQPDLALSLNRPCLYTHGRFRLSARLSIKPNPPLTIVRVG